MRLFLQTLKTRFRYMSKEYKHSEIESKWQQYWNENQTYKVEEDSSKPKFYVLDMFPYPSGAGLHVGHPLGYIASDIYSRYKKLKGFNVLHPMGYDAFGLPAEQYAIQTGQHPAITTKENIARYREQLDKIGFCYDWSRQVKTSEPEYYKWTQWIFLKLFHSWYNPIHNKAEGIDILIKRFEENGCLGTSDQILTGGIETNIEAFTSDEWKSYSEKQKEAVLMNFRLAYLAESYVNWCPALGTVLANDEVKEGVSERGGYPVERKLMMQWSLRITAYSDRLLQGLDSLDWTDSLKEAQRNWIGKSTGASVFFPVKGSDKKIEVFTTRPDTLYGVSYVTLAPEHDWVSELTTSDNKTAVDEYVTYAKNRSERERMADVKKVSGQFTGSFAIHPFTGQEIPIWIGDYVLAGYGTGAVMAVPAHDSRDFAFAKHFNLPIIQVIETPESFDLNQASWDEKSGKLIHSEFLNGLDVKDAIYACIQHLEKIGVGKGKTNFRLRDAIFGRQRYWGEPIPIYYKDGIAYPLSEDKLPLLLPEVDKYLPTETGEPPLGRAKDWKYKGEYEYELSTMPGWAGSSWYFLRYMNPTNQTEFASKESLNYWQQVDLYLGGSEHATGHLLYVRFWTKFLFDLGLIPVDEPAKKLINQGMIQGTSEKLRKIEPSRSRLYNVVTINNDKGEAVDSFYELIINGKQFKFASRPSDLFISENALKYFETENPSFSSSNIDVNYVEKAVVKYPEFIKAHHYENAVFLTAGGFYHQGEFTTFNNNESEQIICFQEVEKMSKSKYNVVTPDTIVEQFGADTLRLYEMFLGPLEQSKPWSTQGIEGVSRFLKKLWRLFFNAEGELIISNEPAPKPALKSLHKTIKKVAEDIENFSFNTSVSTFMICVNELTELKSNHLEVLRDLIIVMNPYAPHITEELWDRIGNKESITKASFPVFNPEYLIEDSFSYPISINGKHRTNIEFSLQADAKEIEATVLADEIVQNWLKGETPKKVIFVKGKIVNIVL